MSMIGYSDTVSCKLCGVSSTPEEGNFTLLSRAEWVCYLQCHSCGAIFHTKTYCAREFSRSAPEGAAHPKVSETLRRQWASDTLYKSISDARKRAKKKGITCSLEWGPLENRMEALGYCCEITGIPFAPPDKLRQGRGTFRNPKAPSFDRINRNRGYTVRNTRIVLCCVNFAINEWGLENFDSMVEARAKKLILGDFEV